MGSRSRRTLRLSCVLLVGLVGPACGLCEAEVFALSLTPSDLHLGVPTEVTATFDRDFFVEPFTFEAQDLLTMNLTEGSGGRVLLAKNWDTANSSPRIRAVSVVDATTLTFTVTIPSDWRLVSHSASISTGSPSGCSNRWGESRFTVTEAPTAP